MPSHWKPEWQREPAFIRSRPGAEEINAGLTAAREAGIPVPQEGALCVGRDGLFRQAIVGLDYSVLVSAVDRLQVANLQERVGRMTLYFSAARRSRALT